jgi:hypothetical protein
VDWVLPLPPPEATDAGADVGSAVGCGAGIAFFADFM